MRKHKRGFTPLEKITDRDNSLTGFTLVEILISLLIFGLGLVILFNLFPLALQSFAYGRKLQEVSILAEKKLEELKAIEELSTGQMNGEEKDLNLNWNITIKPLGDQDTDLMHVELDIELYFQGKSQKQRFVTYLAN